MSDPETIHHEGFEDGRDLRILKIVAEALNGALDLDEALQTVLASVAELLDLQTGWIWLLGPTGESYLAAARELPPALAPDSKRMQGSCYCLDKFEAGDLDGAANIGVLTCSRLRGADATRGLRCHASVAIHARGRRLGVLNVAAPDWRELTDAELRVLSTVGNMLGTAVERARLFAESARLGVVEERNRLAREIHDTLAQGLAAIALNLETADALLESDDPTRARNTVLRALALTRANMEEARRSVLDLRAAELEGRDLSGAIRLLVENFAREHAVAASFDGAGSSRPLPARIEAGLYRIARELLTNIARHAKATSVTVALSATHEAIRLVVEDDGCGFNADAPPEGRFGLVGITERVHLLGGALDMRSCPDAGTRADVTVPIQDTR